MNNNTIENKFIKNGYASTYGELTRRGLKHLLKSINTNNKVFYDLGSGKGNVVIYAVKDFPQLKKSKGIEFHDERHQEAIHLLNKNSKYANKVEFIHGDILKKSLKDGDIFYISNLCFNEKTNQLLYNKLNTDLKNNSIVFCSRPLSHKLKSTPKTTVKQTWWNKSNIYQYIKINNKLIPYNDINHLKKTKKNKL